MEDWETLPNGDVKLSPLTGWQSAAAPMTCALRLRYVETEDQLQRADYQYLQLAMTGPQCAELGVLLLQIAETIARQPKGTKQ